MGHFHLVLAMGTIFRSFLMFVLWMPSFLGMVFSLVMRQIVFMRVFTRVLFIFLPMHFMGLMGHSRKVSDRSFGVQVWSLVRTWGRGFSFMGVLVFILSIGELLMRCKVLIFRQGKSEEFLIGIIGEHTFWESPGVFVEEFLLELQSSVLVFKLLFLK